MEEAFDLCYGYIRQPLDVFLVSPFHGQQHLMNWHSTYP